MAFQIVKNVNIKGLSACVPAYKEDNKALPLFKSKEEADIFIKTTGIEFRHVVKNTGVCTSDLCYTSALKLFEVLKWKPEEIDCLIFVSQTPDYILPATSCILQNRLGLSTDCFAMDISLGCSGWIYGLSVIASLMSVGTIKKGILLVGDTASITKSPKDKSTYPLFGDAGTATAIEFDPQAQPLLFHFGTDGKGYESIIIPDGGFRNITNFKSFEEKIAESGIIRNRLQSVLDGPSVFTFGISKAPKSVRAILEHFNISQDEIDYFIFHQANKLMNEKIRTKLNIEEEKVPYSFKDFGNTSSASIPLTIISNLQTIISKRKNKLLACAFGVGFSWASVIFETENIKCPNLINI